MFAVPPEVWMTTSIEPSATPARHSDPFEQSCVPMNNSTVIDPFDACST